MISEIVGCRFGRLVVVSEAGKDKHRQTKWLCKCDCGNETIVFGSNLRRGFTKSCGCLHEEITSSRSIKHGYTGSRLYRIWGNIKTRTGNKNSNNFHNYGERGISMCNEWRNDFTTFRNWAIANGYKENLTIDRIDINGNYEPLNCRWITIEEQQKNKRPRENKYSNGNRVDISKLAIKNGLKPYIVYNRLHRGWTLDKALSTPKHNYTKKNNS